MAYLRWSEGSSVYVICSVIGSLQCLACRQLAREVPQTEENDLDSYVTTSPDEMVAHLQRHIDAGDKVPDLARVEREMREDASGVPLDCGGLH